MFGWKKPAALFTQTPVPNALVPVAHAVEAVLVHDYPAGQEKHSALPDVLENNVGAAHV